MARNITLHSTVLLAGLFLVATAGASDTLTAVTGTDKSTTEMAEAERARNRKEVTAAADEAIASVRASTKLDLDIRLIGPTSVKVAGKR